MKTHVTKPGAMGGMDAQVVDIGETEREFQADLPLLESLEMSMVTRAKTILFSTAKELAKGNRRRAAPRWSAPAELFVICASPSYQSMGPRRLDGSGVEEVTKTAKKYARAKQELVSVLVHAPRALHTPCSAHYSNGTLIDKRDGQKGMLGTRIIHFPCPWWKSLFAAMVRETVSEGGDEHFSPNWHGFLRGRRRGSNARTTMHGMAPDLSWKISCELAHRHEQRLLVHKDRNDGGGKRTNVQGRPLDGTEIAKRSGFFAGTRRRIHLNGKTRFAHGDV